MPNEYLSLKDLFWCLFVVGCVFVLALVASETMAQRDILKITESTINL